MDVSRGVYRELAARLQGEHKGLELTLMFHPANDLAQHPGIVVVSPLVVPYARRRQGIGTAVLAELTAVADERGHWIAGTPTTEWGATSVARLERFYGRAGFVKNRGRRRVAWATQCTMVRLPHGEARPLEVA